MTDRPRVAHLEDGYDDWLLYRFNDIVLEAVTVRGNTFLAFLDHLRCVLEACDKLQKVPKLEQPLYNQT